MMRPFAPVLAAITSCALCTTAQTADVTRAKQTALEWIDANRARIIDINQAVWSSPEIGLKEFKSSKSLSDWLAANGFVIERGAAGMPTAFVASYGNGKPVVAIMAEFDALPGFSQAAVPVRSPLVDGGPGHACGHSLHGTAASAAAIAIKQAIATHRLPGTIKLYGTPAEELLIGKVYMLRAGAFDDVDAVLYWHPADLTGAWYYTMLAQVSVKFTFTGVSAHASASPHRGRSALDAVELMNIGVNYLREHLEEDARISYVITEGGAQPNDVPARAQVWYSIRAYEHRDVEAYYKRLVDVAGGAALMTGTRFETSIDSDAHELLTNRPLAELVDANLRSIGAPQFSADEENFARRLQESFARDSQLKFEHPVNTTIIPLPQAPGRVPASSDVGDVSWKAPTGVVSVASYPAGIPIHSWPITASAGAPLGHRGMLVAAKVLAATGVDLLTRPKLISAAWADLRTRTQGMDFISLIPPEQSAPK